jgi:hypothetical protein
MDFDTKVSELIDTRIEVALNSNSKEYGPLDPLIGIGELIDRLSIVNQKLYQLKDDVMHNKDNKEFLAQAAIKDVQLVIERSRLKSAIDHKFDYIAEQKIVKNSYINDEVKKYG